MNYQVIRNPRQDLSDHATGKVILDHETEGLNLNMMARAKSSDHDGYTNNGFNISEHKSAYSNRLRLLAQKLAEDVKNNPKVAFISLQEVPEEEEDRKYFLHCLDRELGPDWSSVYRKMDGNNFGNLTLYNNKILAAVDVTDTLNKKMGDQKNRFLALDFYKKLPNGKTSPKSFLRHINIHQKLRDRSGQKDLVSDVKKLMNSGEENQQVCLVGDGNNSRRSDYNNLAPSQRNLNPTSHTNVVWTRNGPQPANVDLCLVSTGSAPRLAATPSTTVAKAQPQPKLVNNHSLILNVLSTTGNKVVNTLTNSFKRSPQASMKPVAPSIERVTSQAVESKETHFLYRREQLTHFIKKFCERHTKALSQLPQIAYKSVKHNVYGDGHYYTFNVSLMFANNNDARNFTNALNFQDRKKAYQHGSTVYLNDTKELVDTLKSSFQSATTQYGQFFENGDMPPIRMGK